MKKRVMTGLVSVMILSSVSLSFAEEIPSMEDKDSKRGMEKGMMKEMMDKKKGMMGMMGPMMMKDMMQKTVVATSDGGVVVVAGNKITKFDKDLNLVGEAQIKTDMAAMKKDMEEMMKMCPMMKGGMKEAGKDAEGEQEKTASDTAADAPDHSAHH